MKRLCYSLENNPPMAKRKLFPKYHRATRSSFEIVFKTKKELSEGTLEPNHVYPTSLLGVTLKDNVLTIRDGYIVKAKRRNAQKKRSVWEIVYFADQTGLPFGSNPHSNKYVKSFRIVP